MESIYIIEYIDGETRITLAILDERSLAETFMSTVPWQNDPKTGTWHMKFVATHYKKEPSGVLEKIEVLETPQTRPKPLLPKIRIPSLKRQYDHL